jgi:hypothetical protein
VREVEPGNQPERVVQEEVVFARQKTLLPGTQAEQFLFGRSKRGTARDLKSPGERLKHLEKLSFFKPHRYTTLGMASGACPCIQIQAFIVISGCWLSLIFSYIKYYSRSFKGLFVTAPLRNVMRYRA